MTEDGFYDGWADFSFVVDVFSFGDPDDSKVVFHGSVAHYKATRNNLRDYLDGELGLVVEEMGRIKIWENAVKEVKEDVG